jgi:hypothetical protein
MPAERPRYFAGQLLAEDDLRSEQDYVLLKNRLHNRYLHGWGVVCGLELGCGDCPGYVTVRPGYALDPCGNDLVVACAQQFDVVKAIQVCQDAQRRTRPDCDPYVPPDSGACNDVSEHWCIFVRYDEQERRPTTALRQLATNGNGHNGCGCGGGKARGCGCGGSTATAYSPTPTSSALGACEPTRILEGFRLGVVQQGAETCESPAGDLGRTFLGNAATCLEVVQTRLGKRLVPDDLAIVLASAFAPDQLTDRNAKRVFEALCRYRQGIREVLADEALPLQCTWLRQFDSVVVPEPGDQVAQSYAGAAQAAFTTFTAYLVDHVRDCICHALMPPCPSDPCDDRVVLGCVEVKDGEIVEVCGWAGRRYAGSFPALSYWLSFGPALAWAICRVCCDPRMSSKRNGGLRLTALLDYADPSGFLREQLYRDDFAIANGYLALARNLLTELRPTNWPELIKKSRFYQGTDS